MTGPVGVAAAEVLEATLLGNEEVDELDDDFEVVEEEEVLVVELADSVEVVLDLVLELVEVVDFAELVLVDAVEMTTEVTVAVEPLYLDL